MKIHIIEFSFSLHLTTKNKYDEFHCTVCSSDTTTTCIVKIGLDCIYIYYQKKNHYDELIKNLID